MRAQAEEVRKLFDRKALSWSAKYSTGGSLAPRSVRFQEAVCKLFPPPADLLDFGCGTGDIARVLASLGYRVTGCDVSPEMLREAVIADALVATSITWLELDLNTSNLPFQDGKFDIIIASSVLEYLDDPLTTLRELQRMLRNGGALLCTVPNQSHWVRRIEDALRFLARAEVIDRVGHVSVRLAGYLSYLRLSRNRPNVDGWHRLAKLAGFKGGLSQFADGSETLLMLAFRKSVTNPCC